MCNPCNRAPSAINNDVVINPLHANTNVANEIVTLKNESGNIGSQDMGNKNNDDVIVDPETPFEPKECTSS